MVRERVIRDVLRECCVTLEEDLNPDKLVRHLYATKCLTPDERELIEGAGARYLRVRSLVDILSAKDDIVLDRIFESMMQDVGQLSLFRLLKESAGRRDYVWQLPINREQINSNQVLPGKWWPGQKTLINTFMSRTDSLGQPVVRTVHDQLHSTEGRAMAIVPQAHTLVGMGGVGKTTLAKWYANQYQNKYDHIIWVDAEGPSLRTSILSLARSLDVLIKEDDMEKKSTADLASAAYGKLNWCKCLFIFDNVSEYGSIREILPKNPTHYVLITSRTTSDWGHENEDGRIPTFHLNVFSREECLQLVRKGLASKPETNFPAESEVLDLGEHLGYLPLALQCAIATITNPHTRFTFSSYLERVKADIRILTEKSILHEYAIPISATLHLSLEQIANDTSKKKSHRDMCMTVINVSAYCIPDHIQEHLFMNLPTVTRYQLEDAVDDLVKYSLLSSNSAETDGHRVLSMHRLLQEVVKNTLELDPRRECDNFCLTLRCFLGDDRHYQLSAAITVWRLAAAKYDQALRLFPQYGIALAKCLGSKSATELLEFSLSALGRVFTKTDVAILQCKVELTYLRMRQKDYHGCYALLQELDELATISTAFPFREQLVLHMKMTYLSFGILGTINPDEFKTQVLDISSQLIEAEWQSKFSYMVDQFRFSHRVLRGLVVWEFSGFKDCGLPLFVLRNYVASVMEDPNVELAVAIVCGCDNDTNYKAVDVWQLCWETLMALKNPARMGRIFHECYNVLKARGHIESWAEKDMNVMDVAPELKQTNMGKITSSSVRVGPSFASIIVSCLGSLLAENNYDQLKNELQTLYELKGRMDIKLDFTNKFLRNFWEMHPRRDHSTYCNEVLSLIWKFLTSHATRDLVQKRWQTLHLQTLLHLVDIYTYELSRDGRLHTALEVQRTILHHVKLGHCIRGNWVRHPPDYTVYARRRLTDVMFSVRKGAHGVPELLELRMSTAFALLQHASNAQQLVETLENALLAAACAQECHLLEPLLIKHWEQIRASRANFTFMEPMMEVLKADKEYDSMLRICHWLFQSLSTDSVIPPTINMARLLTWMRRAGSNNWGNLVKYLTTCCNRLDYGYADRVFKSLPKNSEFIEIRNAVYASLGQPTIMLSGDSTAATKIQYPPLFLRAVDTDEFKRTKSPVQLKLVEVETDINKRCCCCIN